VTVVVGFDGRLKFGHLLLPIIAELDRMFFFIFSQFNETFTSSTLLTCLFLPGEGLIM
jgi:hypothetical protein